ncbi:Head decoration protein D [uncultured Caudovirales phage]|uniref:Head decoration protein D n=1 Tax=uncultured Caudovirales phage TaxID=2100421 RepID=A0A6J5R4A5_9CAUD|nr:Head decoration protein D [uncultured Caudovirales phage]
MTYPGFSTSTPGNTDARFSLENDTFFQTSYLNDPVYDPLGQIDSTAVDSTHTSYTAQLRVGLVMARLTSGGNWVDYDPTANDGSQIAAGILAKEVILTDPTTGTSQTRQGIVAVSGKVKSATGKLIGLDQMARMQLRQAGFIFDDASTNPTPVSPFSGVRLITTATTLTSADYGKQVQVNGSGSVTVTLPALANGAVIEVKNCADQTMIVASAEGTNIVVVNNAGASSLTFSTSSMKLGAHVKLVGEYFAGTLKWVASFPGTGGTQTCTVA